MKRRYRVSENKRFQEIRRAGRSFPNELLVLCALPNGLPYSRFGFSVSSRIGNAVTRNRIKRRLREAVRLRMDEIAEGWDIVLIARNPIRNADYHAMDIACARLLRRAQLLIHDAPENRPELKHAEKSRTGQNRSATTAPETRRHRALPDLVVQSDTAGQGQTPANAQSVAPRQTRDPHNRGEHNRVEAAAEPAPCETVSTRVDNSGSVASE